MKVELIVYASRAPAWLQAVRQEFSAKLGGYFPFSIKTLKSPSAGREDLAVKRKLEGELLLAQLEPKDLLILFDEKGRVPKSSRDFSALMTRLLESGKARIVFCIGGAYGFDEPVKKRSSEALSLSPLTMNHLVAEAVALEQIYRAMTLIKGVPYHND